MLFDPATLPDRKWLTLSEVVNFRVFGEVLDVNATLEASSLLDRALACNVQEVLQRCPDTAHPEYSPWTMRKLEAAREQVGAWFASGKVVFKGHRLDEEGQDMGLERIRAKSSEEVGIFWEGDFISATTRANTLGTTPPGTYRAQRVWDRVCIKRASLVSYLSGGPGEPEVEPDENAPVEQLPDAFAPDVAAGAPATAAKGAPPKFAWSAFLAEVEDQMSFHGDFDPSLEVKWNQAALERHMKEWAENTWDCAPGRTRLRAKVKEGVARYRAGFGQ